MKVFLVERIDGVDFDEARSMVIIAEDAGQALGVAAKEDWGDYSFKLEDMKVTEQKLNGEPRVILIDFNAG